MTKYLLLCFDQEFRELLEPLITAETIKIIWAIDALEVGQKSRKQKFHLIMTNENTQRISLKELVSNIREVKDNFDTPVIVLAENPIKLSGEFHKTKDKFLDFIKSSTTAEDLAASIQSILEKGIIKKKSFKLDVHFINPFIDSSLTTLKSMLDSEEIKGHKPYLLSPDETLPIEISGTLEIESPYFTGMIGISFDNETYKVILSKMLSTEIEEINKDNQDGAAELINIIYGQTKSVLNKEGYDLQKALPSVLRGKGHKITPQLKSPILTIPIDVNNKRIFIQINVKPI